MSFLRRFSFQVILRVLVLFGTLLLLATIFLNERLIFNQLILASVIVFQVWELIRYVNRTNRELSRFFLSVRQSDYTALVGDQRLGQSFADLIHNMTEVIKAFRSVQLEKEAQHKLLEELVKQIPVGIIVIKDRKEVILSNQTANDTLSINKVISWKGLKTKSPDFVDFIEALPQAGSYLMEGKGSNTTLSVHLGRIKVLADDLELITFSDIQSEIEQKEIEAWHKLIRILTHEIMNSVTPVASLSETLQQMLQDDGGRPKKPEKISQPLIKDLLFSIETIQKRSEGLLDFVEKYRRITRVPKPEKTEVETSELLDKVAQLSRNEAGKRDIDLKAVAGTGIRIHMDRKLIEQVLINLIKNATDELSNTNSDTERGRITMRSFAQNGRYYISVEDNGPGLDPENKENIWIPFYSTKEGGSGIGLSFSKQVMKLHGGTIKAENMSGTGARFVLEFPSRVSNLLT